MDARIEYIEYTAKRWEEEVRTAGKKTELTMDDVKRLRRYVDELKRIEATFAEVVRNAENFIKGV